MAEALQVLHHHTTSSSSTSSDVLPLLTAPLAAVLAAVRVDLTTSTAVAAAVVQLLGALQETFLLPVLPFFSRAAELLPAGLAGTPDLAVKSLLKDEPHLSECEACHMSVLLQVYVEVLR